MRLPTLPPAAAWPWLLVVALSACQPSFASPTPAASFTPIATFTATSRPSRTASPNRTAAPAHTPVPTAFTPFQVTVLADNVNLRANPGTLFPIRASLAEGDQVVVLGRSLGSDWAYVRTAGGMEGWVFAQLLVSTVTIEDAPPATAGPSQMVSGQVLDENGQPVSGVHFALVKGTGDDAPRSDAITGQDGWFYSYLPLSADGEWNLYYTAIACASNVMDRDCNCLGGTCGQPFPSDVLVRLPQVEPFKFVWR